MTVVCDLVTDPNGLITHASREAASLLGIEDRWLLRKPLATFVTGRDRQRFRNLLLELGSGRSNAGRGSFVLEDRRGAEISAEASATSSNGTLSWRLKADAEIADGAPAAPVTPTERLFERLLNRLPNGVVIVDRDLKVVFVNPAARTMLGKRMPLRAGEPLPEPWPDFSVRELAHGLFTRSPASGGHLVPANGHVLCVEGLVATYQPTATILLEDVTERERTRQAERQFVENAAHELRTPLAAIVSVVDVLEGGAKEDPEARDRFLSHIRDHSQRLVRLATSLLVLARIQTGREIPRLDLVPLKPLLEDVAKALAPSAEVTVEVRAADHVGVLADRDLLYEVLENVAANAKKHTREGQIVLEARDLGRTAEIELRDTGSGMEEADASHAFDRFYRSAIRDENGFGLGLAIADEAIRVLGGTISLDSTPNVGTRVRIRLPSAKIVS